jgi:hypothetical protein
MKKDFVVTNDTTRNTTEWKLLELYIQKQKLEERKSKIVWSTLVAMYVIAVVVTGMKK